MNEKWYKDLMAQKFQYDAFYDPTRLFIALALVDMPVLKRENSIHELAVIVYRYYIANLDVAKRNININIRNIQKYGVSDIIPQMQSSINQWIREQQAGSFSCSDRVLYWSIDSYDDSVRDLTKKMVGVLFQKYFKSTIKPIMDIASIAEMDDMDLEVFGNSALKQRVMEEYQYCPLSEEVSVKRLRVVHICPKREAEDVDSLVCADNALIMDVDFCEEYNRGLFYFDEFGRVHSNGSTLVNKHMRLGMKILTEGRKKFIRRHYLTMTEGK